MTQERLDNLSAKVKEKRRRQYDRLRRHIEMGYVKGRVHPNGAIETFSPKGIQHWYDTRTLIRRVTERFDLNEAVSGRRVCHINGKWQLQIRGKHLRRLLKAMPNVKQVGRMLVEEKE